jgi:hypothetical protein
LSTKEKPACIILAGSSKGIGWVYGLAFDPYKAVQIDGLQTAVKAESSFVLRQRRLPVSLICHLYPLVLGSHKPSQTGGAI